MKQTISNKEQTILEELNELNNSMDYFSSQDDFDFGSVSHRMYWKDFERADKLEDQLHELRTGSGQ